MKRPLLLLLFLSLCVCSVFAEEDPFVAWEHDQEWVTLTNHLAKSYAGLVERCEALNYYNRDNRLTGVVAPPEPPTYIWPVYDYMRFARKIDELTPHYVRHTTADPDGSFRTYFATNEVGMPMWDIESLHAAIGIEEWSTNMLLHSWALNDHSIQKEVSEALNRLKWTIARHQRWIRGTDGEITGNHGAATARVSFVEGVTTYGLGEGEDRDAAISNAVAGAVFQNLSDLDSRVVRRSTVLERTQSLLGYRASFDVMDAKLNLDYINPGITGLTVTVTGHPESNDAQGTDWQYRRMGVVLGEVSLNGESEYTFEETLLGDLGTSIDDLHWPESFYSDENYMHLYASLQEYDLYSWFQWEPDPLCDELHRNLIEPGMHGVDEWRNADVGLMAAHSRDGAAPEMYSVGEVRGIVAHWVQFHSRRSRLVVEHLYTNVAHKVDYYARAGAYGAGDEEYHPEFNDCGTGLVEDQFTRFASSSLTAESNVTSSVLGSIERAPLWSETNHCVYGVYLHSCGYTVDAMDAVIKWSFSEVESLQQDPVAVSPDIDRDGLLDIGAAPDSPGLRTGFVRMAPDDPGHGLFLWLIILLLLFEKRACYQPQFSL